MLLVNMPLRESGPLKVVADLNSVLSKPLPILFRLFSITFLTVYGSVLSTLLVAVKGNRDPY